MKRRNVFMVLCLLVVTVVTMLAGCSGKAKKTVKIDLEANPTTGYEWEAKQSQDGDEDYFDIEDEYEEPSGDAVGAGGVTHFILKAERAGEATVDFYYGRNWEEEDAYAYQVSYTFDIDDNLNVKFVGMTSKGGTDAGEIPSFPDPVIE